MKMKQMTVFAMLTLCATGMSAQVKLQADQLKKAESVKCYDVMKPDMEIR